MAMAWITGIFNRSSNQFSVYQNDRTYHPVINGQQYRPDQEIVVPPGASLEVSWGVIPWFGYPAPNTMPYGRLGIVGPKAGVEMFVTSGNPPNDPNQDYVRIRDANLNIIGEVHLGPRGWAGAGGSANFHLIFRDNGVELQLVEYTGPIDFQAVGQALADLAPVILSLIV